MHAWIKSTLLEQLDHLFVAGEMYEIHNFMVVAFVEKYKCFEADRHIILMKQTIVKHFEGSYNHIPLNIFKFTNLKNIAYSRDQDAHLVGNYSFLCFCYP